MSDDSSTAMSSDDGVTDTVGGYEIRTILDYIALVGFVLFAAIAALQLYTAVGGIITRWITPEYRVFFRGAFNLVVLLLCVGGISMQLERLN